MAIINIDDARTQHAIMSCPLSYDPNFDYSQCINACADAAGSDGTLQFTRGQTYKFSERLYTGGRNDVRRDGMLWEAIGSGARPILNTDVTISGGAIEVTGNGVELNDLDIRGFQYNQGGSWLKDGAHYGINATHFAGQPIDSLHLDGVSVNGFGRHGIVTSGDSEGLVIDSCQFSYNGGSGIALFGSPPPSQCKIRWNTLANNGENGIDCESVSTEIIGNSATANGWARVEEDITGEGHGIVLNGDKHLVHSIDIKDNMCNLNWRSGIEFVDSPIPQYEDIAIIGNTLLSNGQDDIGHGVTFGGDVSNTELDLNIGVDNKDGCWNLPYTGVTEGENCCDGVGGPGVCPS